MILATWFGSPTGALIAALVTPVTFILLFILLARDPGPRRHVGPGHPAYTGKADRDDEHADEAGGTPA